MRKAPLSGQPPKQPQTSASQQQTNAAGQTPAAVHQPDATHGQQGHGCPGTHQAQFDCNTVSAIANVRQADAAERFNNLAGLEIGIGFVTAIAAVLAARWAKNAAKAARDTVKAFTEVERADIAITLEKFREQPGGGYDLKTATVSANPTWLLFDVVANNIGRSTALITRVSHSWQKGAELEEGSLFIGPPKKYIVRAGKSEIVTIDSLMDLERFKTENFLWLMVSYKAPLRDDERVMRVCFEVFGPRSNIPYHERKREEWDQT